MLAWLAFAVVLSGVVMAWADPVAGHALEAAALVLGAVTLVGRPVRVSWLMGVPLVCAAWGLVQRALGWTAYSFETMNAVTAWGALAAISYVAFATFEERRFGRLLTALECAGGALSLVGLCLWSTSHGKIFWPFVNYDQWAAFVELIFPIAVWRTRRATEATSLPHVALAGLLFASVVAGGSRAGTGIVLAETVILIPFARVSRRGLAATAASMAICTAIAGGGHLWERLRAPDALAGRREMLSATVQMIETHPVRGSGLGTWPTVYPAYAAFDPPGVYMNHAHNDWMEWAAEGGLPMAALLLAMAIALAARVRRNPWGAGVVAALMHSAIDFPMQKPALATMTFYLAGALVAASARPIGLRTSQGERTNQAKA